MALLKIRTPTILHTILHNSARHTTSMFNLLIAEPILHLQHSIPYTNTVLQTAPPHYTTDCSTPTHQTRANPVTWQQSADSLCSWVDFGSLKPSVVSLTLQIETPGLVWLSVDWRHVRAGGWGRGRGGRGSSYVRGVREAPRQSGMAGDTSPYRSKSGLACFILPDEIFQTLQLTIICYETKESVRKSFELNSIKCAAARFFKVLMVYHGFYNGKKINDIKNDILDKVVVHISLYYAQIKENSNIWGVCFLTLN